MWCVVVSLGGYGWNGTVIKGGEVERNVTVIKGREVINMNLLQKGFLRLFGARINVCNATASR